jgi:cellulase/cellobiase CelA1
VTPGACAVRYELNQWSTGFTANVTVTNGGAALNGWALTWTFPGNQQVTNSWSTQLTQSGTAVTAKNLSWNGTVAAGSSVGFGFTGSWSGANTRPASFKLGDRTCTVA